MADIVEWLTNEVEYRKAGVPHCLEETLIAKLREAAEELTCLRAELAEKSSALEERDSFLRQCEQLCQRDEYGIAIRESGIPQAPYVVMALRMLETDELRIIELERRVDTSERELAEERARLDKLEAWMNPNEYERVDLISNYLTDDEEPGYAVIVGGDAGPGGRRDMKAFRGYFDTLREAIDDAAHAENEEGGES